MNLEQLEEVINKRKQDLPATSYTADLFREGLDRIVQKFGEEAVEVLIAAKGKNKKRLKEETADLLYALLVLLRQKNISLASIYQILNRRNR